MIAIILLQIQYCEIYVKFSNIIQKNGMKSIIWLVYIIFDIFWLNFEKFKNNAFLIKL